VFISWTPPVPADGKPAVIITEKGGGTVTELKVAKWNDAFEAKAGKVSVRGPNTQGTPLDFIDRDNDRFNVRVSDPAKWDANVATIDVTLRTIHEPAYSQNDDPFSTLRLVKMTQAGWYWSDSLMMVSNKIDDEYTDARVGTDEAAPGANLPIKGGYVHPLQDRTHRIALGGSVLVKYDTGDNKIGLNGVLTTAATVPVKKVVNLYVNVLKDPDGDPVVSKQEVNNDVVRANELYAQLGIRVIASVQNPVAPPGGVDLSDGLSTGSGALPDLVVGDTKYLQYKLIREQLALASAPALYKKDPADATKRDNTVVHIYYVNRFTNPQRQGVGIPQATYQGWNDVVFMTNTQSDVLAHELFHVLENILVDKQKSEVDKIDTVHYPYTRANREVQPLDKINLMVSGAGNTIDGKVTDSVRLDAAQQDRAYARATLVKAP
ncbi:MAG: hypothetical protein ACRC7O_03885, partial [Fimbriiglobus sp.]